MDASKSGRAATSIGLLLGFYALTFGVVGALAGFNVLLWNAGRISPRLAIATVVIAILLLRAVVFVKGGVEPPTNGLRISAADQPELFRSIEKIAEQMDTTMPDEVYLIPDVNAYVVEDTAMLGLISRRRILAVGVGLMNALEVDQLEAVIAHEFGHYAGSDTRLGAVAYRGWESIVRAVNSMGQGIVRALFMAYAKFYLRVSGKTSRAQELAADRWAADIGGTEAAASALEKIDRASAAYSLLMNAYVAPLAASDRRPRNLFEGYRALLADEERQAQITEFLEEHPTEPSPYDTHPPAKERVAAIRSLPVINHTADRRPARELLHRPEEFEMTATTLVYNPEAQLTSVEWQDAGPFLRDARAEAGSEVVRVAGGGNGDAATAFLTRLATGDQAGLRRDLSQTFTISGDSEGLRPYIRAAVVHLAGPERRWTVDWSGVVAAADLDIDSITDDLLAGGDAARAAAAALSGTEPAAEGSAGSNPAA